MDEEAIRGLLLVRATFGQVLAFEDDFITEQLLSYGAHTRCELAFFLHFVDAGDAVLDVGAHIGTFAVPLAQKVGPSGRVVAVEADPRNYALLLANARLTDTTSEVHALNVLVGSPAQLYQLAREPGNTGMSYPIAAGDGRTGVRGLSLDEIASGERHFAAVKIAIQGMELESLLGADSLLGTQPIFYVQAHQRTLQRHGASQEKLGDFLRHRTYRFFINTGDRNAAHDRFTITEIQDLSDHGPYINVLAIPKNHPRLDRVAQVRSGRQSYLPS